MFIPFVGISNSCIYPLYPDLTGKAVDEIVSQGNVDFAALINIIKKIIMAMAATAISQWLMNHINNIITYRVVKDIRTKAFGHLEVLPLSYIDSILLVISSAVLLQISISFLKAC